MLRQLRRETRLTQEELAEIAGISARSVSDLERGINATARKDTARRRLMRLNPTWTLADLVSELREERGRAA